MEEGGAAAAAAKKTRDGTPAYKKLEILVDWEECGDVQATLARHFPTLVGKARESKRKDLYAWRKARGKIETMAKKKSTALNKKHRPLGAATALPEAMELRLVAWVNRLRGDGVPITSLMLQLRAVEMASAADIRGFVASPPWQRRFLQRRRLSMRTKTRQGQIPPEDAAQAAAAFAAKVVAKMNELGVSVVFNADQTAVFFEYLPKKTIDQRGSKTVWVRCAGVDKQRVTVMLLADSTGKKYPPTIVAKTRPSKILHVAVENIVERHGFGRFVWRRVERVQDQLGFAVYGNSSGWWNEFLHRDFLDTHFGNRADMSKPVLLLLDEFSGHWTSLVVAHAAKLNVHLISVPPGLTSVCQPADVSWMRPFKDYIRGQWIEHLRAAVASHDESTKFKLKPPRLEDVAKWVKIAWDKVTPGTIQAGYRRTGMDATDVVEHLQHHGRIDPDMGEMSSDVEFDNE